ncbi:MAG: glycosyltransferase family 2 protein [Actinomycetota bacterium]
MATALSVIVLSWNRIDLTRTCVESIRANTDVDYELIVVDNGSGDGSAELASEIADVAILNDSNRGFSAGMNQGLGAASGKYVVFVNNDTTFPDRWASSLIASTSRAGVGMTIPAVTTAGMDFAVRSDPGDRVSLIPPFSELPSGVVIMMPRWLADELGGWDEAYALAGAEDFDLLFTVWANGLDVVFDERVLVEHVGSASVIALPDKRETFLANRNRFLARWSNPHEAGIRHISGCNGEDFAANLENASLAAQWIAR